MVDTGRPAAPDNFAAMIRNARRDKGLTQADLASRAGVSLRCITRWEAGEATSPQPGQLAAVCRVLGINPARPLVALGYMRHTDLAEVA